MRRIFREQYKGISFWNVSEIFRARFRGQRGCAPKAIPHIGITGYLTRLAYRFINAITRIYSVQRSNVQPRTISLYWLSYKTQLHAHDGVLDRTCRDITYCS